MPTPEFDRFAGGCAETLIALALAEDLGEVGDLTSTATIPIDARGSANFVSRSSGVIAGLPVVAMLAERFELAAGYEPIARDGDAIHPGSKVATVAGPMRSLLALERTALNFLQRLSGIASLTARFVAEVAGPRCEIFDTRKTTPGWRALEKYAVRCGGGRNHRFGLYDAVLIKDNHLAWLTTAPACGRDPIALAVAAARAQTPPDTLIEVEVDTLGQLDQALACHPDIVLLDNHLRGDPVFRKSGLRADPIGAIEEAVRRRDVRAPSVLLEASGRITPEMAARLAETGINRISVGALTHSALALDIGLDFDRPLPP